MNNIGFKLIACLLIALSFVGCSDKETEKKLIGTWVCSQTDNSDGEEAVMTFRLKLKESHKMQMSINVSVMGFSDIASVSTTGTWKADKETLWLNIDDKFDININSGIEFLAGMMDVDTSELKREMRNEIEQEMSGFGFLNIRELKSDIVVFEEDGESITFVREGSISNAVESEEQNSDYTYATNNSASQSSSSELVRMRGEIGGKYPVEMELDMADLSDVTGRYRYTSSGSGDWLYLKGDYYKGRLSMKEYNDKGECCGSWEGDCFEADGGGWCFSGTMTNYSGKTFSVELQ